MKLTSLLRPGPWERPDDTLRRLTLAGLFTALAVLLSTLSIPVGPTRCFPFQHSINVMAGVLLGPWWAAGSAFVASFIRVSLGTGTLFAFPGSIPGALLEGLACRFFRSPLAALTESIGTGVIGAWIAASILGPAIGRSMAFSSLSVAFLASSVPGALLGLALLYLLRRHLVAPSSTTRKN